NEEEVDVETLKNILGPDAGIIERDEEGNVINVILGKSKEELEEDKEVEPAPAKTDIVWALEEEAAVV
ncbi:1381_t:CDS:2, partial [Paraglomus occultum]